MKITQKAEGWSITIASPPWVASHDHGVLLLGIDPGGANEARAFVLDRPAAEALWEAVNAILTARPESPFLIEEHAP